MSGRSDEEIAVAILRARGYSILEPHHVAGTFADARALVAAGRAEEQEHIEKLEDALRAVLSFADPFTGYEYKVVKNARELLDRARLREIDKGER